jgi:DNA invertase Pin-like site-specific DNA recombinase
LLGKATGINLNRPELQILLNQLRDGGIIVVESYDRLCRSTLDLLTLIDDFESKNVGFISIKENFNTMNAMGRLLLTVVAAVGEMERKLMLERQKIGIKKAQMEGKYKGRQPVKKPDNFDQCLDRYLSATKLRPYPFRSFLKDTNLKRSTLIKFINQAKIENKIENKIEKTKEL